VEEKVEQSGRKVEENIACPTPFIGRKWKKWNKVDEISDFF